MKINNLVKAAGLIFIVLITLFLFWQLPGVLRDSQTRFGQPAVLYYIDFLSWIFTVALLVALTRYPQTSRILISIWLIIVLSGSIWGYLINYISSGRLILRIIGSLFVLYLVFSFVVKTGRDSTKTIHNKISS
jgi:hypothetical protein